MWRLSARRKVSVEGRRLVVIVFVKEGGTRFVLAFLCLERGKEREEKSRERERVLAKLVV